MEEILYRRYHRVLEEGGELPDLIVVDGGKGQLSSAVATLRKLDLLERVPIIGLADVYKRQIQFRMLNLSKGPAMWSPRAQCDRMIFSAEWRDLSLIHIFPNERGRIKKMGSRRNQ